MKKLVEEFCKEEIASQWAGLPPEKLLQESFLEQLDALQSLDQLAPVTSAKEHLPGDIIQKQIVFLLISYTILLRIAQTDITQRLYRHLHIL